MTRPVYGDLLDMTFEEFKNSGWYKTAIKPFKDKIQYPDNFMYRIFQEGFIHGRISKINHNLTTGELIHIQMADEYLRVKLLNNGK
jgi:hypothetical protein